MTTAVKRLNEITTRYFLLLIVGSVIFGAIFPDWSRPLKVLGPALLVYNVLVSALSCEFYQFGEAFRQPAKILPTLLIVFGVLPFAGYLSAGTYRVISPEIALGLLLVTILPSGVTGTVWTALSKGNVALSVTVTGTATLLSGVMIPTLLKLLAGQFVQFDMGSLFLKLINMIMIPVLIGTSINSRYTTAVDPIRPHLALGVKASIVLLLVANASSLVPTLAELGSATLSLVGLVIFLNAMGYIIGYGFARKVVKASHEDSVSLAYAAGTRNNVAGITLAQVYFHPVVSIPVTISFLLQHPLASVANAIFLRRTETETPLPVGKPQAKKL